MLTDPEALDRFLDDVFSKCPIAVSVKTRLGMQSPEEFPALLEIFNRYPIRELTVHPRVRQEFYRSPIHFDWFDYAVENSRNRLCYNGNLCTPTQIRDFEKKYPQINSVMIGRGLIGDPGMLTPGGTTAAALESFLGELLEVYTRDFGGARNAMFRLKENIEFIDMATNRVDEQKSARFQQALEKAGFAFPAQWVAGIPTSQKSYDEGYFALDSEGHLFHVKMTNGKPFVKDTKVRDISCMLPMEIENRSLYGFLFDTHHTLYYLSTDGYRLVKVLDDVDPDKDRYIG